MPVENFRIKLDYLLDSLDQAGEKIIVPTPALSEILVLAGQAGPNYLAQLEKGRPFRIVDFDKRAAIQHAAMTASAIHSGDKKEGSSESWAKVKFDRQIVAIAKVEGCSTIYSDDKGVRNFAQRNGMSVIQMAELPMPHTGPQSDLPFGAPETEPR